MAWPSLGARAVLAAFDPMIVLITDALGGAQRLSILHSATAYRRKSAQYWIPRFRLMLPGSPTPLDPHRIASSSVFPLLGASGLLTVSTSQKKPGHMLFRPGALLDHSVLSLELVVVINNPQPVGLGFWPWGGGIKCQSCRSLQ